MSKSIRRLIFYALVLLFLALGFITVYYATGWRFNFQNFKFEHVGAIYVQAHPDSANIYINNKLIETKPSFFQSGVIINDLLPNSYNLKVSANGYQTFSQNIIVAPFLVSTLDDLILIPEHINYFSTSTVKDFWLVGNNLLSQNNNGYLFLNNIKISGQYFVGQLNNQKLLTNNSNNDYFLIDPLNPTSTIYLSAFIRNYFGAANIKTKFFPNPQNNELLTVSNQYLGWLNTDNWTFAPLSVNTSTEKFIKNSSQIIINSNKIYALSSGDLIAIDTTNNQSSIIASSSVLNFSISPDNSKIAILKNNQIEILKNNQNKIIMPLKADKIIWYNDSRHLFAINNNSVYFLDIKNQESINYQLDTKSSKFEYVSSKNQLYFLCPAVNAKNTQNQNICYLQFPD